MNSISTIIDGDTLIYTLAYNLQNKTVEEAEVEIDKYIELILRNTHSTHYLGFLGEHKVFRHNIYDLYKSKRPEKPEFFIKWEYFIKHRLVNRWKFVLSGVLEAEDCAIICANHYKESTNIILAHIDKDLNFWEGNHYNYSSHQHWYTDKLGKLELQIKRAGTKNQSKKLVGTGLKFYYAQLIIGDSTDCIPSMKRGCGDVYAYNLLNSCDSEFSLLRKVYSEYLKYSNRDTFIRNRSLVKMLDKPDYGFTIPELIPRNKVEEIDIFTL